jgi:hypothetical protein
MRASATIAIDLLSPTRRVALGSAGCARDSSARSFIKVSASWERSDADRLDARVSAMLAALSVARRAMARRAIPR